MKLVAVEKLTAGMMVGKDINLSDAFTPLIRRNTLLTKNLITLLRKHKIQAIYVMDSSEQAAVERMYSMHIPKSPPVIRPQLRAEALKGLAEVFQLASVDTVETHNSSIKIIRNIDRIVDQLVASLENDSGALVNISSLKSFDEYTYHHSLSVAVLALAIAQRMDFERAELTRICKCAIMHDIGKTAVPIDIIHKPSTLNSQELTIIRQHSFAGYDFLQKSILSDEEINQGVLHHHERMDGFGYPDGLKNEDIPIWSRIISVADVYDALTSTRPYRLPLQPSAAVEYLMGGCGTVFDYDVVKAFMKKIELYPLGSQVELSNGKIAIVYNNDSPMRPLVRLIPNGEFLDLQNDRSCMNIVINSIIT